MRVAPAGFLLVIACVLSACSYSNALLDFATGTSEPTNGTAAEKAAGLAADSAKENVSTEQTEAAKSSAFASNTVVGAKVQALDAELRQLQSNVAHHQQEFSNTRQSLAASAQRYFSMVAGINARLQAGTTPGNPELVSQSRQAQSDLNSMDNAVAQLNSLSNAVASDSSFANYLLDEVRSAYSLRGGVEADRERLQQIEGGARVTIAQTNALLDALTNEVSRQRTYIAGERNNLVSLADSIQSGQLYGPSLGYQESRSNAAASIARPTKREVNTTTSHGAQGRPFVVIRFNDSNVQYQKPLYNAVRSALERKPSATFTIEAVAPKGGTAAEIASNKNASRQNADAVVRSLTAMGLSAERISLSATTSADVQGNEVRIYVH